MYVESVHEDFDLIFGRLCAPCHILGYQKDSRQVTVWAQCVEFFQSRKLLLCAVPPSVLDLTRLHPCFLCRVMFLKTAVLEVHAVSCGSAVCLKQSCEWCLASFRCVMMVEAATAESACEHMLIDCETSAFHAFHGRGLLMHGGAHIAI